MNTNWPNNPNIGDVYVNAQGIKWKWNGRGWVAVKESDVIYLTGPTGATGAPFDVTEITSPTFSIFSDNTIISGHFLPDVDSAYDLGTSSRQWKSLHVSSGTIYLGGVTISTYNDSLVVNSISIGGTGSNFQISSGENNLTIGGDLIVQGNMTVNGTTSTINTENLVVKDPLILLASGQEGIPVYDSGILINRGSGLTQALIWDESEEEFSIFSTTQSSLEQNISVGQYSNFKVNELRTKTLNLTDNDFNSSIIVSGNDFVSTGFENIVMTSSVFDVVSEVVSLDSTDSMQLLASADITVAANGQLSIAGQSGLVSIGNTQGLVYYSDYSSGFTNRSLVDKEYVDSGTSSIWSYIVVMSANTSGTSGTSGSSGTSGTSGSSGTSGTSGSSGTSGQAGSSGAAGTSGTNGTSGSSGTSGTSGISGTAGSSGTSGTSGSSGTSGTSGSSGTSGTSGLSGVDGTSGSSGTSGSPGASGTSGSSGISGTSGTTPTSDWTLTGGLTVGGTSSFNGLTVLQAVSEVINTTPGATAATVVYDFSTGSNWYHSSANTNFTANFINVPITNNRAITTSIVINQGATPYIPTAIQINSVSQTIKWSSGTASGTANQVDIVGFTFIRDGAGNWAQVLGQINTFD